MNTRLSEATLPQSQTALTPELRIQSILVPLDFSRASMHAFKYALQWAGEFKATVHLVHVQPIDELSAVPGAGHLMLNCVDAIALMQDRLAEAQEEHKIGDRFWPDNCHVVSGRPYQEICNLAEKLGTDLIILPTRGHSGLKRLALGSTAERVVRHAACPVLIPRGEKFDRLTWGNEPKEKLLIRQILAPTDFSESSLKAVKYAALVARYFGAKLTLLNVVFPYTQVFQMDRPGSDPLPLVESARAQTEAELVALQQLPFLNNITCKTKVRIGAVVDEICAESSEPDIDLVVTSTHGRTGFSHAMIGSVAEHIVRYAESPVLVLPTRDHGRVRNSY